MKAQYALFGILMTSVAHSADFGIYANSVSAHNIAAAQHEIANRFLRPLGGAVASSVVTHAEKTAAPADASMSHVAQNPDAYGEMLYYGEFGDDTGVLPLVTGHSGGDTGDEYFRVGGHHFSDNVKFKSNPRLESTSDLVFAAYGKEFNATRIEFFGGYAGGHTENSGVDIKTNGAFIGASYGKKIDEIELTVMADFGIAANDVDTTLYDDDFSNFYAGIFGNVAYDYVYDGVLTLHPAFRAGYTFVNSANYMLTGGESIANRDYGFFELTPIFDIIGNIGDGFSIGGHLAYVLNFATGGKTMVDYVAIPKLKTDNYFEYGISLGQNFDRFSLNINLGRHEGARNGWNGGAEFKYAF